MAKKAKTKKERDYHSKVAELTCMARGCNTWPVTVHHMTGAGTGLRASHFDVMPLCPYHHQHGNFGEAVHNGTKSFEKKYGYQREMVEKTQEILGYEKE